MNRSDEIPSPVPDENQTNDNAAMLPIEPMDVRPFQNLTEDCLLQIFTGYTLTPIDLCSLAETCVRFKRITQRVFSKSIEIKHRHSIGREPLFEFHSKYHSGSDYFLPEVERILKNFGSQLSKLSIKARHLAVVDSVAKYCRVATMKRLKISELASIEGVRLHLSSIFKRLQQLSLYRCDFVIGTPSVDSLVELKMVWCRNCAGILRNTFANLERFIYIGRYCTDDADTVDVLAEFFRRNGSLKSIFVHVDSAYHCKILDAIGSSCNELEALHLEDREYDLEAAAMDVQDYDNFGFDFSHLQSLPKLKTLDIMFLHYHQPYCGHIEFTRAFPSIQTIRIENMVQVSEIIFGVLSQMQNLRELYAPYFTVQAHGPITQSIPWTMFTRLRKLHIRFGDDDVVNIVRQLTNLEELHQLNATGVMLVTPASVGEGHFLTEAQYSKIVKIVERREHVLAVYCDFNFNYFRNGDDTQKVKLIKKEILITSPDDDVF